MRTVLLPIVAAVIAIGIALPSPAEARRRRRGKKVGAFQLTVSEDGAKVTLDGKNMGMTPVKQLALAPGAYEVAVRKLGYLEFKRKFTVKAGKTVTVKADLLPFAGVIEVRSSVSGATVSVDGEEFGTAPGQWEVKLGTHTVTVTADGYDPWEKRVSLVAGKVVELSAKLTGGSAGAVADAGNDDLELAPIDELELELPSAGDSGGAYDGDELALEMPPLSAPGDRESSDGGDELGLEALPGLEPMTDDGGLSLVAPGEGGDELSLAALPPGATQVTKDTEPPPPWYLRWYTIAGGATVLAAAIIIPTAIAVGSQGPAIELRTGDLIWCPGGAEYDCVGQEFADNGVSEEVWEFDPDVFNQALRPAPRRSLSGPRFSRIKSLPIGTRSRLRSDFRR